LGTPKPRQRRRMREKRQYCVSRKTAKPSSKTVQKRVAWTVSGLPEAFEIVATWLGLKLPTGPTRGQHLILESVLSPGLGVWGMGLGSGLGVWAWGLSVGSGLGVWAWGLGLGSGLGIWA
jgi:hypothetical protein